MAPDEPTETPAQEPATGDEQPEGVFGNLPRTRPGARSPRRDAQQAARAGSGAQAGPGPDPAASKVPDPTGARTVPDPPAAGQAPGSTGEEGGGIEDVAWAGVAAAAEAATIGVRLATKALEAMRDAVDRR